MDEEGHGLEDFSIEMADFEVVKTGAFDRMWRITTGASFTTDIAKLGDSLFFGSANHNLYAVRASNGGLLWKFRTNGSIVESNPVVHKSKVYFGSFDRFLYCLEAESGRLAWKFETGDMVYSTPAVAEGMVVFGGRDHNVYALDAETGTLRWKFRTHDWIMSSPTIVGGRVFIGSSDHFLYCLELGTGRLAWKFETQGEIYNVNGVAYKDNTVYFTSFDNYLRALDAETGRLLWRARIGSLGASAAPVFGGDILLQQSRDGILFAFDMQGKLLWKFSASNEDVIGIPEVHGDRIFIGSCADYNLHCLDLSGRELWRFATQGMVFSTGQLIGDTYVFPSWDCSVYAIDVNTKKVKWKFTVPGDQATIPPPHEVFELRVRAPISGGTGGRKSYEVSLIQESDAMKGVYSPRIVYGGTSRYREKGNYQSTEEDF